MRIAQQPKCLIASTFCFHKPSLAVFKLRHIGINCAKIFVPFESVNIIFARLDLYQPETF